MNEIYISECKKYIAFHLETAGHFDVIDKKGNYWPNPPYCKYPLARCIGGFSNKSKNEQRLEFTLDLLECDTSKKIKPGMGNTIIKEREIFFRRKMSYRQLPCWAKAMAELLKTTRNLKYISTASKG